MKNKEFKRIRLRRSGLKDDDEGVATTVGTIMALLVFLSLLSLITQQYVPVWMEDKEAYHMDEVMVQFSYLKGNIDNLVMNDFTDYPLYSTFKLGSEGVPLFASSSPGIMRARPGGGEFNLYFNSSDYDEPLDFSASGNVSLEVMNRYFEEQKIVYEYGAILLEQGGSEDSLVRANPPIDIQNKSGSYYLNVNLVDIRGEQRNIGGTGSVGVTTELLGTFRSTFQDRNESQISNTTISLNTYYPSAWKGWLLNETDLKSKEITVSGNRITVDLSRAYMDIEEIKVTLATVDMTISV